VPSPRLEITGGRSSETAPESQEQAQPSAADMETENASADADPEAQRIAEELNCTRTARLPTKACGTQMRVFMRNLLRDFGATYIGPLNQNQAGGNPRPGVCVPGKPLR
jgi:hypothetical protein